MKDTYSGQKNQSWVDDTMKDEVVDDYNSQHGQIDTSGFTPLQQNIMEIIQQKTVDSKIGVSFDQIQKVLSGQYSIEEIK